MTTDDLLHRLQTSLEPLGFSAHSDALLRYVLLMDKWNRAYNLTAIREPEKMLSLHILDSLAIAPWLQGKKILDVGTGGGLPGIPLALTHPQHHFVLLDSNGKKIRFLQEIKRHLPLDNVQLEQRRVEDYQAPQAFDTVVSRAFSSLEQMLHWTRHLISEQGLWLAMKGRCPHEELKQLHYPWTVQPYRLEGLEDVERCCVLIKNTSREPSWQKS